MRSNYKWIFALLVVFTIQFSNAQEKTITGVVTDDSGPLPGVNVIVKGTQRGVATGFDGKYAIKAKAGEILVFSFLGMSDVSKVVGNESIMNTIMSSSSKELVEVVVTAQSKSKEKKTIGYNVSTLKTESLENRPQTDVVRTLQGKISGVQITNTGGMAGSTSNIVIRGNKSFTGSSQPLFIIDGVPFDTGSSAVTDSFNQGASSSSSRFGDIDPNNIESMSILKGLAASVTYGSQGRNGVVLITTKKGSKSEKINLNYSSTLFFSEIANLPDYQNKYGGGVGNVINQGAIGNFGAAFNGNQIPHIYDQPSITSVFPQFLGATNAWIAAPNNVKDFFRTGVSSVHSLNVSGGSDKIQYSFNGSYSDEDGFVAYNNITKYNFGTNINVKASDKLKFNTALTYFNTDYTSPPIAASNGAAVSSIFERLLFIPRNYDINNLPYQNPVSGASIYYRGDAENPRWLLENSRNSQLINRIFGKIDATYSLSKKIDLTYKFGLDRYVDEQEFYQNKGGNEANTANGYLRNTTGVSTLMNQDLIFDIKPLTLVNEFKVDGFLGFNSRRDTFRQKGIASVNQTQFGKIDHTFFANQANFDPVIERDLDRPEVWTNTLGIFSSADFSYNDYLYLNLSARNDFVSSIEAKNQSIFYPSASLSFIPTDAFEKLRSNTLGYWKLRMAYGTSAGFPDRYLTRGAAFFNSGKFVQLDGTITPGTAIGNDLENPNLKPELHKEFEIGTDVEMFNKRLELGISAYNKISENQIVDRDLDPTTGYTGTTINAGRLENKGIEGNISIIPVKTSNFSWTTGALFYKNVSEVIDLPEGQERINIEGFNNGIGNYAIEGQPYGVFVGTYALKDSNGKYLINPSNGTIIRSDQVGLQNDIIGDPNPDYSMSFDNTLDYKGFRLNVLFEYVKGGDFYSVTAQNLLRRGVTTDTEANREGSVIIPGVYGNATNGNVILDANGNSIPNTIQIPVNNAYFLNFIDADSQNVYDATRVRLREASLTYSLPYKFLKDSSISGLTFSLTGQNLWLQTFNIPKGTNIDPDLISTGSGNGLGLDFQTAPQSRRYGFSVKVNF
jgi:TonB-linked SusC/RagA family outer membrane protein